MESIVKNGEKVKSLFGYWPQFCDARVVALSIKRLASKNHSLTISLSYIDSEKSVAAEIEVSFFGVSAINLSDFFDDNVLDELSITESSSREGCFDVSMLACCGLTGSFKCELVEVTSLKDFPL
jgi:hypothetical protein